MRSRSGMEKFFMITNAVVIAIFTLQIILGGVPIYNNTTVGDVSAAYPTPITPAPYAFFVWFVIVAGVIGLAVYQFFTYSYTVYKFNLLLALSLLLSGFWMLAFNYEQMFAAFILALVPVILLTIGRVRAGYGLRWNKAWTKDNFKIFCCCRCVPDKYDMLVEDDSDRNDSDSNVQNPPTRTLSSNTARVATPSNSQLNLSATNPMSPPVSASTSVDMGATTAQTTTTTKNRGMMYDILDYLFIENVIETYRAWSVVALALTSIILFDDALNTTISETWAVITLLIVSVLTLTEMICYSNVMFPFTVVWALVGILVALPEGSVITTWVLIILALALPPWVIVIGLRLSHYYRPPSYDNL